MGKRSPRNSSSLACPTAMRASRVAFSANTNVKTETVPACSMTDWGIENKPKSSSVLDDLELTASDDIDIFYCCKIS